MFTLFQLVMSNLQSILENVDTPELLCQSVTCILQVARCYPHIFSINFRVSRTLRLTAGHGENIFTILFGTEPQHHKSRSLQGEDLIVFFPITSLLTILLDLYQHQFNPLKRANLKTFRYSKFEIYFIISSLL